MHIIIVPRIGEAQANALRWISDCFGCRTLRDLSYDCIYDLCLFIVRNFARSKLMSSVNFKCSLSWNGGNQSAIERKRPEQRTISGNAFRRLTHGSQSPSGWTPLEPFLLWAAEKRRDEEKIRAQFRCFNSSQVIFQSFLIAFKVIHSIGSLDVHTLDIRSSLVK